jgi:hypothetical protein
MVNAHKYIYINKCLAELKMYYRVYINSKVLLYMNIIVIQGFFLRSIYVF